MILSKAEYIDSVNYLLPDNSTQLISPLDIRTSFINLADSAFNMVEGKIIKTANFASVETRTTVAGDLAINNRNLPNTENIDNTAVGYYALGGNHRGIYNTAVGSNSLGCNLYGNHNVSLGFNCLAGNLTGSGNIGIGNYALRGNKHGDFNIAIGHGAGYYAEQESNYKLYIGAHAVDTDSLCGTTSSGIPLLYGDLKGIKLSVGNNKLDSVFTIYKNSQIPEHASSQFIQSWYCDNNRVAAIDCNGNFFSSGNFPNIIEGYVSSQINPPINFATPTSGILTIVDKDFNSIGSTYITNKDKSLTVPTGVLVVAVKINDTYRPIWVGCE